MILSQSKRKIAIFFWKVPEAFSGLTMLILNVHVIQGVGKRVHTGELDGITSQYERNDDHLILVKKYETLQEAVKRAVYTNKLSE